MDDLPPMPPAPREPGQPEPWVQVPTPLPAPKKRSVAGRAAIVVLVVVGVVAIIILTTGGGSAIPDELAGQPRITSGPTADILEAFDGMEVEGVTVDIAIYGTEIAPAYMVMLASGDVGGDAGNMLGTLPTGAFTNAGATIDFSRSIRVTTDGVEYVCAPASNTDASVELSMCLFAGGDVGGAVMSFTQSDLQGLLSTTQGLVQEIG